MFRDSIHRAAAGTQSVAFPPLGRAIGAPGQPKASGRHRSAGPGRSRSRRRSVRRWSARLALARESSPITSPSRLNLADCLASACTCRALSYKGSQSSWRTRVHFDRPQLTRGPLGRASTYSPMTGRLRSTTIGAGALALEQARGRLSRPCEPSGSSCPTVVAALAPSAPAGCELLHGSDRSSLASRGIQARTLINLENSSIRAELAARLDLAPPPVPLRSPAEHFTYPRSSATVMRLMGALSIGMMALICYLMVTDPSQRQGAWYRYRRRLSRLRRRWRLLCLPRMVRPNSL